MFSISLAILKKCTIRLLRESVGSCLVDQPCKRLIDSIKGCLKKRGLNVGQARRMMYDGD